MNSYSEDLKTPRMPHALIAGIWKFSASVPLPEVAVIARELAASDPGYLEVFVRKVGQHRLGVCFIYRPRGRGNIRTNSGAT